MEITPYAGGQAVRLTHAESLVLFEWLCNLTSVHFEVLAAHSAEQRLLLDLMAGLESQLVQPFLKDYPELLSAARDEVAARGGPKATIEQVTSTGLPAFLVWHMHPKIGRFQQAEIDGTTALLRMNDFPDEPLYTFIHGGTVVDMEDLPPGWVVNWE